MVLTPTTLYTFKEERKYRNPTEVINLKECSTIKSAEEEVHKPNAIVSASFIQRIDCPDRTYYFVAESSSEKEGWIGSIG